MGNFDALTQWELPIPSVYEKYKPGESTDSYEEIRQLKPVFSFEYLADKGDFSYDNGDLVRKDYVWLLKALRDISDQTYETMSSDKHKYHFHDVDWSDTSIAPSVFKKCIRRSENDDVDDIEAYQFKVFQEARVFGFIYKGVFYVVLFDRGHNIYNGRRNGKKKGKKAR